MFRSAPVGAPFWIRKCPPLFPVTDVHVSSSQAFFQGKLKISGNMGMAMKLQNLQVKPAKAKL